MTPPIAAPEEHENLTNTTLVENAAVYGHPDADAILLGGGRILAIGDRRELHDRCSRCGGTCRRISLEQRLVVPGFIDAHTHFLQTGVVVSGREISLAGLSRTEVLEELIAAGERQPEGDWILARGWDEATWDPPRYLSQQELDRTVPHHPVAAVRIDGHIMVLNAVGVRRLPEGVERPPEGGPPGVVREEAVFAFGRAMMAALSSDEQERAFAAAADLAHSLGITSVHAMATPGDVQLYRRVREQRRIRVNLCPEPPAVAELIDEGIRTGSGDAWLRYGGVKLFADGSIGAANAAVSQPFVGGTCGRLNHSDCDLQTFIAAHDEAGWQTVIHAIGDRAIEQVLAAHGAVGGNRGLRHRIEHYELPNPEHLGRTRALGVWLCVQPNFIGQWSGPGSLYVERMGEARDRRSNPLRAILDAEIGVGFGSDGMPMGPLYGIRSALLAPYDGQRLSFDEALDAYTRGSACLSHEEGVKGTLSQGAFADLAILSTSDVVPAMVTGDLEVDATFLNGELVFER